MSGKTLADYTHKGDTWWFLDADEATCPECGGTVSSNGKVRACTGRYDHTDRDCDWWESLID